MPSVQPDLDARAVPPAAAPPRALAREPRRSVTNHHGHASRSESLAHEGTVQPSLRARYSAIAANAASTRLSPVLLGAWDHIRAAAWVPVWRRTLV